MDNPGFWEWTLFSLMVVVLLAVDLFVHRHERAETRKWAIVWTVIWVAAGLAFNVYVWIDMGSRAGQEYLATYLIEKSLSLDNLFVFLIIFRTLSIPKAHQRTALSWGVFGALFFRATFIFAGAAALQRWEWVVYVFGVILIFAAIHAFREDPAAENESKLVEWLARHFPITHRQDHANFFLKQDGRWRVTPLFVAVVGLELTDIMFAIDSVPAAFSVTYNTFIIYSSNVFAILGLRSLYMVLAQTIAHLKYLHYGLAAVLAFAGVKLFLAHWVHIHPMLSVGIIVTFIGAAIIASLLHDRAKRREPDRPREHEPQMR